MDVNLLPKVKQLINQTYATLVSIDDQKLGNLINSIGDQIKRFIKEDQSAMSKDLAKKTKELFILSSDNQSLRQKVQELQNKEKRLSERVAEKQKAIIKIMNDNQRQKRQLQQEFQTNKNQLKKENSTLQYKVIETQTKYKNEISDLRRAHKQQISKAISKQQDIAESNLQKIRHDYAQDKKTLIQTQNKERSELIKKYEHKLQDLRDKNQEEILKLNTEYKQIKQKDRRLKNDLQNQLVTAQNNIKRLQGQLSKELIGHQKYKSSTQILTSQLQSYNKLHGEQIQQLQTKLKLQTQHSNTNEKKRNNEIKRLQDLLQATIKEKDLLFQETVGTMSSTHQIQLETVKNIMMQERQIAVNQRQVKHYSEIEKLNDQQYCLQKEFNQLKLAHQTIKEQYELKLSKLIAEYEGSMDSLQNRNSYQLNLQGQSSKKNVQVLERKYKLQIKALKIQCEQIKEQMTRKVNQQRISTTNKLTTHYEGMINDIKINNDISMKQKLIQFDKKSKGYEKKLSQLQKRRLELKITLDRQKLQMQMKVDSMHDINERQQAQIQELHNHILKVEKEKTKISNEYEFKLIVKTNELQQVQDDYEIKEQELRNILNQKIRIKNTQIQRFSQKVTTQVQALIQRHTKRINAVQKQYSELKRVMGEKTSLPQDIQALKVFHRGYLKLQEQLQKQKQLKRAVQRQLHSKCAIEKVFVSKSFVPKIQQKMPIKIVTMKEFYTKQDRLIKIKSQNL